MRSIAAVLLILALPVTAQAIRPERAPDSARLPGIAERTRPDTARLPGNLEVRVVTSERSVARDLRDARRSIERRRKNGELTRREARALKREVSLVARLARRYGQDGLSGGERGELTLRANELRSRAAAPSVAAR